MGGGNSPQWGSRIYEVQNSRLVKREFQSRDCSGAEYRQEQIGPMVGGTGSCVPADGPSDNRYAKSMTLNASSKSSWTYKPAFSDQGCKTPYGVYMLGDYISGECTRRPPGVALPPSIPNTTQAIITKCDSSDTYTVCTYDNADCSGQSTKCLPFATTMSSSGNCSSRPSNWGSLIVYK